MKMVFTKEEIYDIVIQHVINDLNINENDIGVVDLKFLTNTKNATWEIPVEVATEKGKLRPNPYR